MTLRFFVCGLILMSMTACDSAPRTFISSQELRKAVISPDIADSCEPEGHLVVNLSAKFDETPRNGMKNAGVAYYRVEISNPSDYKLSVNSIYVEFEDEMEISIEKCRLYGRDNRVYGNAPILIEPGAAFSASGNCEFPISQMDLVEKTVALVGFGFFGE